MAESTASTEPEATVQSQMSPIRIQLINAIDQALILRELLSPKSLRSCELEALPDPDSIYVLLPPDVVRQLGLRLVDQRIIRLADGREEIADVTEALRIEWNGKFVTEDALVMGNRAVLGQGALAKLNWATAASPACELANEPASSEAVSDGATNGFTDHPTKDLANEPPDALADGLTDGLTGGLTGGLTDGLSDHDLTTGAPARSAAVKGAS